MAPAIADPELGDAIDLAPKSQIELLHEHPEALDHIWNPTISAST